MNDANRDHQERDVLDDIDEAVAQITEDQIEERLLETLRRAGRVPGQHAVASSAIVETDLARLFMRA
jgi:hypothetical protein